MPEALGAVPQNRRGSGRFQRGISGNPGGRPKGLRRFAELAGRHTQKALQAVVAALDNEDDRVKIQAAHELFDRAYGKPAQALTGAGGEPLVLRLHIDLGSK